MPARAPALPGGPHVDGCIATRTGNCGSNEAQVREISFGHIVRNPAGEGAGAPRGGRHVDGCIVVHGPGTHPRAPGFAPTHGG